MQSNKALRHILLSACISLVLALGTGISAAKAYTISGTVKVGGVTPLSGVLISGGSLGTRTTNANGYYEFASVPYGTVYTLVPSKSGYTFSPPSAGGTVTGNKVHDFNATLSAYTISGTVKVGGVTPLSGVLISGGALGTRTTNANGYYEFTNVPYGTVYTLVPSKSGYTFSPPSAGGTVTGNKVHDFNATLSAYTISGTVKVGGVTPLSGVLISGGALGTRTTNANGYYEFANVPLGTVYTLVPSKSGYTFSPPSAGGTVTGHMVHNFSATAIMSSSSSSSASSISEQGCITIDITVEKGIAKLGPEELEALALQALAKLQRQARKTSKTLAKRLARSAKRSEAKMNLYIAQAKVQLDQLPDFILVCNGESGCAEVDNTKVINQYITAIRRLRNTATRALNRATRLTAPTVQQARRMNVRFGRSIKAKGRELIAVANSLPKQMSVCG